MGSAWRPGRKGTEPGRIGPCPEDNEEPRTVPPGPPHPVIAKHSVVPSLLKKHSVPQDSELQPGARLRQQGAGLTEDLLSTLQDTRTRAQPHPLRAAARGRGGGVRPGQARPPTGTRQAARTWHAANPLMEEFPGTGAPHEVPSEQCTACLPPKGTHQRILSVSTLPVRRTLAWLSDVTSTSENMPCANEPVTEVGTANRRVRRAPLGLQTASAGGAHLPQLLLHLAVHGVGAEPGPRLHCSLQRLLGHLVPLEVDKDGVVEAPGPAQADQILA